MGITEQLEVIRKCSSQHMNMLEDLMEQYGVSSLGEITEQMANEYIDEHKEIKRRFNYEQMVNGGYTRL